MIRYFEYLYTNYFTCQQSVTYIAFFKTPCVILFSPPDQKKYFLSVLDDEFEMKIFI